MKKQEEIVKAVREELGVIQSCALLMAHAQSADVRLRYLKTVGEKISRIDSALQELPRNAVTTDK